MAYSEWMVKKPQKKGRYSTKIARTFFNRKQRRKPILEPEFTDPKVKYTSTDKGCDCVLCLGYEYPTDIILNSL